MSSPVLQLSNIVKEFSGVRVLHEITLDVLPGEVLGILGENGAGKSTLLKIISGIYTKTSGTVSVNGKVVNLKTPVDAKKLGIAMIPQEFNLISSLNVFENIFLGSEIKSGLFLNKKTMREQTHELLKELKTDLDPNALIEDLTVAQKQMVEIAKALVSNANILIMDEPTTVLTEHEVRILFELVERLKARGVTILFISHKLKEVKQLCDRLAILRDGHLISLDEVTGLNEKDMARKMVGRELNQIYPEKSAPQEETVLKVSNLSIDGVLKNINFELKKGEVLGFSGLVGAGRTETAEAIMGLRHKDSGALEVNGKRVEVNSPVEAVNLRLAYLSEDRQGKGLILNFDIPKNITLISLKAYVKGLINKSLERKKVKEFVSLFDIKAASLDTKLINLSGGNQQKVYLSKWMDTYPEILILDEPTRGIDVNTKKDIYHFIRQLIDDGLSVIFISSELEEIIGLSNRVIVMRSGEIMGELTGEDINEEEIMYHAAGLTRQTA
ncbi:sugar ABC transporter ATP-binding protein [Cocleimonas flava]|uniref:Monosaccharide ABC transporter ATP-binding protein (CUT2 family) n=1 Tax=Cocleimonas flava TaxID=634765 RepID=A0A4R1EPC0_9GAMM|nr:MULTISPECIES: sugar ABC transporter ATP-binding protein [Cocleimonas]MEB8432708.1 sugar ABC transporter ATP-binding protein [Cocleimonas sp. KMM 6892]MEC4715567.1 sugar ABC transporter ATP-binding protein [Cocleimonas sp. KMM 6895]MEC4744815.1 sugar ABC transporter ATP-binding protein [Cocleimonas sp. KMM 6896]TCJ83136.1 monosaccharide ABC transporter ATP-binding protein (CUT2 family) [Cocleimonas flava]